MSAQVTFNDLVTAFGWLGFDGLYHGLSQSIVSRSHLEKLLADQDGEHRKASNPDITIRRLVQHAASEYRHRKTLATNAED